MTFFEDLERDGDQASYLTSERSNASYGTLQERRFIATETSQFLRLMAAKTRMLDGPLYNVQKHPRCKDGVADTVVEDVLGEVIFIQHGLLHDVPFDRFSIAERCGHNH